MDHSLSHSHCNEIMFHTSFSIKSLLVESGGGRGEGRGEVIRDTAIIFHKVEGHVQIILNNIILTVFFFNV